MRSKWAYPRSALQSTLLFILTGAIVSCVNAQQNPESLFGTWELTSITLDNVTHTKARVLDKKLTARFDSTSHLGGYGGCNEYYASYSTSSLDSISVGEIISSKRGGPSFMMKQEELYFKAIYHSKRYSVKFDSLELYFDVSGKLSFVRSQ